MLFVGAITTNPFYPSFRMYFNLLTLLVPTTLIMKRAPVFLYRNLGIRCFQLKQRSYSDQERLDEEFIERLGTCYQSVFHCSKDLTRIMMI